jgi:hypothetical protein
VSRPSAPDQRSARRADFIGAIGAAHQVLEIGDRRHQPIAQGHGRPPAKLRFGAANVGAALLRIIGGQGMKRQFRPGACKFDHQVGEFPDRELASVGGDLESLPSPIRSLQTNFSPPPFSFAGHPASSRVAAEFAMKQLKFLGAVGHNAPDGDESVLGAKVRAELGRRRTGGTSSAGVRDIDRDTF